MLKDLLDYLNKEIYPFMTKEQVKKVKPNSLTKGLMAEIDKYSKQRAVEALTVQKEMHEIDISSYKGTIERLKQGVLDEKKDEWRKGKFGKTNR
ncbi:MAG: hypothetical protein GY928_08140 [Colwellia sp.]|nr:hypothetical protein [Colwellia sp.]